jgi:hypothetical protein
MVSNLKTTTSKQAKAFAQVTSAKWNVTEDELATLNSRIFGLGMEPELSNGQEHRAKWLACVLRILSIHKESMKSTSSLLRDAL